MKLGILLCFIWAITFSSASCNSKPDLKVALINTTIDSMTPVRKFSITDLANQYKFLDGQNVQTEGTVYFEFENVAICVSNGKEAKCFWLDFHNDMDINYSLLQKASGKNFILKGTIDISRKGHLNEYLATIKNIYYLKTN